MTNSAQFYTTTKQNCLWKVNSRSLTSASLLVNKDKGPKGSMLLNPNDIILVHKNQLNRDAMNSCPIICGGSLFLYP